MNDAVRAVADAVLYEGLLLFPYRKNALKNQLPWQFGVLMPQGYADPSEPSSFRSEVVVIIGHRDAKIEGLLRFLQSADVPTEREIPFTIALQEGRSEFAFAVQHLRGTVTAHVVCDGNVLRVALELRNDTSTLAMTRNEALPDAFVSAHAILIVHGGTFASLLDPPDAAKDAVSRCVNERVFPVLAGRAGDDPRTSETILISPIILYDYPAIAKASRGHTFDATEIDELLMLSVKSLSDDEKQQARAAHPYARELVERAEALDADTLSALHGELTGGVGEAGDETLTIGNACIRRGSRVRVHPKGRADLWDDLVDGMTGRVCAVHTDFDGNRYVGVVFDGDPASDLHEWYGRSFFYAPDEIEALA